MILLKGVFNIGFYIIKTYSWMLSDRYDHLILNLKVKLDSITKLIRILPSHDEQVS